MRFIAVVAIMQQWPPKTGVDAFLCIVAAIYAVSLDIKESFR